MTRSKWPTYDPATDGNPFRWILEASEQVRDPVTQRDRQEAEAARIADRRARNGRSQEDDPAGQEGQP